MAAIAAFSGTVGVAVLRTFPTAAECTASGRTIDATFRHCESAEGYVELREHALFHVRDALFYVVVLGLAIGGVVWAVRRRRRASTPTAP